MKTYQDRIELSRAVLAVTNTIVLLLLAAGVVHQVWAGHPERVICLLPSLGIHLWAGHRMLRFYLNRTLHP